MTYEVINWTVSKNIQDVLWKFTGTMNKEEVPDYFKNFRVFADDHNDVERCIFMGLIPGASFTRALAANRAEVNGFDYGWYLSKQFVPLAAQHTNENINPSAWIKRLLVGEALDFNNPETGIDSYNVDDVPNWDSIKKSFNWDSKITKWIAIQEIAEHCGFIFVVKWRETGGAYYPCAYFIDEDNIDTDLDLPAMVTIANPSDYLLSGFKVVEDNSEKINQVKLRGSNTLTGDWYTATEETAAVTAGDELPITFQEEVSHENMSQVRLNAWASYYYNILNNDVKTYIVRLKDRYDLELYQKIKFTGYTKIPEDEMRITGISYIKNIKDHIIEIAFTLASRKLSDYKLITKVMTPDTVTEIETIVERTTEKIIPDIAVGMVTAIVGDEATVELEDGGGDIKARIL